MVVTKEKPEYVSLDDDDTAPSKNSRYKNVDPIFAGMRPTLDAALDQVWEPSKSLEDFRKAWSTPGPAPEGCPIEDEDVVTETRNIPMRDGAEVEIKIYKSKDKKPNSALMVRCHGGGWVIGGHVTENYESLMIAARTNTVVVSVDYRMAPEYRFPYAVNDCFDALKWCKANAESLGADPDKMILNGSSAGSQLATAVGIMARDEGITGVVAQVLTFLVSCHPKFMPRDRFELESYRTCADASIVNPVRMEWFLDTYMPDPTPDWRFSTLLAPSLKDLPPAFIISAGFDIFRDEGLAFAERMKSEGGAVELHVAQGLPHCYYSLVGHPKAVEYYEQVVGFTKKFSG